MRACRRGCFTFKNRNHLRTERLQEDCAVVLRNPQLWVIKIGGSLASASVLKGWLRSVTNLAQIKAVIVPGGGPFADQVRHSQAHWKFDDATAHRMALLAMEQYGLMMSGLCSEIKTARNLSEIESLLQSDHSCIWLPYEMTYDDKAIPENWEMTSDSLAAWLANLLNPEKLILIKSVKCKEQNLNVLTAVERKWIDPLFPEMIKHASYETRLLYKDDYRYLGRLIQGEAIGTLLSKSKSSALTI